MTVKLRKLISAMYKRGGLELEPVNNKYLPNCCHTLHLYAAIIATTTFPFYLSLRLLRPVIWELLYAGKDDPETNLW